MGISVAISGDTIVAGAQNATVGSNAGQGAAYIFVKPSSGWTDMTETAKLTASDGKAGDGFGGSVGISSNTIVVGACPQSGMCNGHGKVYVFLKPKSGWKTTSKFKAELTGIGRQAQRWLQQHDEHQRRWQHGRGWCLGSDRQRKDQRGRSLHIREAQQRLENNA